MPEHIAGIRADPRTDVARPLHFTTLNGCASTQKGAEIVIEALRALHAAGLAGRFRLDVWGYVGPSFRAGLQAHPEVRIRGSYTTDDLSEILREPDVGIVPSAWEETFGFTGLECVAAGVPVIGNARGGITDYVRDGETGWRNEDADGEGLARIIQSIVDDPAQIADLSTKIVERRDTIIKPMRVHTDEIDALYASLA